MLPQCFAWTAKSLGDQLHMPQPKYVKSFLYVSCTLPNQCLLARFRTEQRERMEETPCRLALPCILQFYCRRL